MTNAKEQHRGLNLKSAGSAAHCASGHKLSKFLRRGVTELASIISSINMLNQKQGENK